ncbi:multiheme c-type cytochrome [Paracnuella aquatica]|uniref:multiheme c-type cytochrome n=1 Tax=Paracnuella aquatica TaxID=2268757 RepID=UPI0013906938|nr:multiheme c-type cytochrome [Paracnuella aquatica]
MHTKLLFARRSLLLPLLLVVVVLLLSQCMDGEKSNAADKEKSVTQPAVSFAQFAGSQACASCHADVYKSHVQTAHFRTSAPASDSTVLGSFNKGRNTFHFNDHLSVVMERRDSGMYQAAYQYGEEKLARRIDLVIGSGTMGQSFLHWRGHNLFQLPITFFAAANAWSNSPGFPPKVVFNRVITSRCMECHTTFAQTFNSSSGAVESFDRGKIIFGVDCEKCHGPAAQHVAFQQANPDAATAKYIVNPARLSRQQQLDLCALCHGGALQKTAPSFSFTAGSNLSDFFVPDSTAPNPANIDVHGNQYGLLRVSKCFTASTTLTCNSCHNTHANERGNKVLFSQRCMACHQQDGDHFCTNKTLPAAKLATNCIDCHMPEQPSRAIAVFLPGKASPTAAMIRSHYISVNAGNGLRGLGSLER